MSTSQNVVPAPFAQPISQTMINNPTINMISNVSHIHTMGTNADAFKRLFDRMCVDALTESGLYDQMKCHPGTRELILERLENSVAAKADRLITWLDGPMGSGKTSVAVTMADRMSTKKKLIGSFVFRRGQPGRNEDTRFVATLTYQMALSIPLARPFIEEQISHDHSILHQSLSRQLDALILTPLRKMRSQNPDIDVATLPNLIIVDGLDECGPDTEDGEIDGKGKERGKEEQQLGVLELLHRLALAQDVLPFAVLVHSRPEMHINHWFTMDSHARLTNRFTLDSSYNPSDDIRLFVTHGLLNLLETHPFCLYLRGTKWPYEVTITNYLGKQEVVNAIELIVERSEGLFVYASMVLGFIASKCHPPSERLLQILVQILEGRSALNNCPPFLYTAIDALYTQILDSIRNPRVTKCILYYNYFLSRWPSKVDLPLSKLFPLLSISTHDFNYFKQQSASILTLGTDLSVKYQHSSLHEFLRSRERSQHWCIDNWQGEMVRDLALNALKLFAIESCVETQLSYHTILTRVLHSTLYYRNNLEDPVSLAPSTEIKAFFDFQNSSYRTPVLRMLTSDLRSIFFRQCSDILVYFECTRKVRYFEKWALRFASHIGTLVKPQVERYVKSPRTFAMLVGEAFGIPASNPDYTEDISKPTDCPLDFPKLCGREWAPFFEAPDEWILHVFSIPNLEFLSEAFTILLKHAGRPSVMFDQKGLLQFINFLDRQGFLSQELWLAILDCDEYLIPYVRGHLHDRFLFGYLSLFPLNFRSLRHQHQYCLNPILPFRIALGQCYWEPRNVSDDINGNIERWFLQSSTTHHQQILIPSVPPLAQFLSHCNSTGRIPLPKHGVHCLCSGRSCFDEYPKWMRI